jgi:hypothetical protein
MPGPQRTQAVLNVIMEVVSAEAASVLLLDEDRANFQFYSIEGPAKQCLMGVTFPADRGIAGSILQAQRSEVINDAQRDPRFFKRVDSESGFVTKNLIAIPLTAGEEKIGVMQVLNKSRSGLFTDEERLLLDSLAEEIAFAIRNAKLFELVVKSYCKIRQGEHSCRGCKRPLGSWTPCVKYLHIQSILILLGQKCSSFGINPFTASSALRPKFSSSIDIPFQYADHIRNFFRFDDNFPIWQVSERGQVR